MERDGARRAPRQGDTIREAIPTPGEGETKHSIPSTSSRCVSSRNAERSCLAQLLEQHKGRIAARAMSVDQATLHRKIKMHGLRAGGFRDNGRR